MSFIRRKILFVTCTLQYSKNSFFIYPSLLGSWGESKGETMILLHDTLKQGPTVAAQQFWGLNHQLSNKCPKVFTTKSSLATKGGPPFLDVLQYWLDAWRVQSKPLFHLPALKIYLIYEYYI